MAGSRSRDGALRRARLRRATPHPAAPKLTSFAKAPHPSPARGEGSFLCERRASSVIPHPPRNNLSHFPVRQQIRGAVGEAVAAGRQHIAGMADGERLLGVLLDQQDADAALVDRRRCGRRSGPCRAATGPPSARPASAACGSSIRARPIATIWRCPPESSPAGCFSFSRKRRKQRQHRLDPRARCRRASGTRPSPDSRARSGSGTRCAPAAHRRCRARPARRPAGA